MTVGKKHLLVNSLQRSGGTLVARLFDGHPELRSMPFEFLYAPEKVRWPSEVELAQISMDWEEFCAALHFERNFGRMKRREFFSKDQYSKTPIDFDFAAFEAGVKNWFCENRGSLRYDSAVSAVFACFFDAWLGENKKHLGGYYVNHLSMMCFSSPARYLELFPDGKIVQSLRDPLSWYASMKGHFGIEDMDEVYMTYAMEIWTESVIRGVIAARFWPENYAVVRYGDLVRSCTVTMRELAAWLGIRDDASLSLPTMGGRDWRGNSSFGAMQGVSDSSLEKWRSSLTAAEIEAVTQKAGRLGEILGAEGRWSPEELPDTVPHPSSGFLEPLRMANLGDLVENESRRMSVFTHRVFTRTIQRTHGDRYSNKGAETGLMGRVAGKGRKRLGNSLARFFK